MEIRKDHIEYMEEQAHTLEELIKLKMDDLYRLGYAIGYAKGYDYGKKEGERARNN